MSLRNSNAVRPLPLAALLCLFGASGAAALVYEVLWLKELGRLFGVTSYATATTLAVFFLGLALGGLVWGRRAERIADPLRTYALLEAGIAISALLYLFLFNLYRDIQEPLFGSIGYHPVLLIGSKFVLACGILLLPSFFMGGTLPVAAQYLVRHRNQLGTRTTLLYAVNTLGAATGALAAGFLLPRFLGYRGSYLTAIALNLAVALIAWNRRGLVPVEPGPTEPTRPVSESMFAITVVAGFSGFATLSLEVIWTRMFSQVLQNSVYTFSIVLGIFLICLALGSGVAHLFCRRGYPPRLVLSLLLVVSGCLVGLTPLVFTRLSGGLDYMSSDLGFVAYVGIVFGGTAATLGPAVVTMGAVFPFLMKLSERFAESAGRTVGRLLAINTVAAIAGSLLAGFLLLDLLGVWASIRSIAVLYILLALAVWPWSQRRHRAFLLIPLAGLVFLAVGVRYGDYSRIWLKEEAGEELVEAWEGAAGSVAVARMPDNHLRIRVNSSYNLGTSGSAINERLQGQLPLALHGKAHSVFFLGLGTGITASGAVQYPVERIVVCEVNSDIIKASRKYFGPWLRNLFDDERVSVLAEDGRTWLAASRERFDVIVADIFLSFKSDVGSLYTIEHFEAVREHLQPGGIFVQWVTLFDMSVPEFEILAKTMRQVFPSVTVWRRGLSPSYPMYALVGRLDDAPLDAAVLDQGLEPLQRDPDLDPNTWFLNIPLAAYVTNISALDARLAGTPVNTDDRTVLEYMAPVTERNSRGSGRTAVLAWEPLLSYLELLAAALPPDRDPYLAKIPDSMKRQVDAGLAHYGYVVHRALGNNADANRYLDSYNRSVQAVQLP